jgi:hypothetical protein
MTTANAKALGFSSSGSDGAITFNSGFSFYYGTDVPPSGLMSFYSVAVHEIGHVLGFVSIVDNMISPGSISPTTLDLFRFASAPATVAAFTTTPRALLPGASAVFSDVANVWAMSTGLAGDGFQASHWKADELSGSYIGIMDPSLAYGVLATVTGSDVQAFNLIGWDTAPTAVPEPGTWAGLSSGLLLLGLRAWRSGRRQSRR